MPGEEKFSDGIKSVVEVGQQALGQGGRIKGDAGLQINPSISLHTNTATPFLTGGTEYAGVRPRCEKEGLSA